MGNSHHKIQSPEVVEEGKRLQLEIKKKFKNYESYSKLSDDLDYQVVTEVAAAGGMYITENYFIHLGKFYVNIVPLSEIVFVYKNSQIRDMHILYFKIKYNVHIKGNRKFRIW